MDTRLILTLADDNLGVLSQNADSSLEELVNLMTKLEWKGVQYALLGFGGAGSNGALLVAGVVATWFDAAECTRCAVHDDHRQAVGIRSTLAGVSTY